MNVSLSSHVQRSLGLRITRVLAALALGVLPLTVVGSTSAAWSGGSQKLHSYGELDCNGQSKAQRAIKRTLLCTDIRGIQGKDNANTWGGKFYDNGLYIGHDEPDMNFVSSQAGTGNNVTWTETIGFDPSAAPTNATPGSDVSHWFELSIAPWFSMALCDSNSYPQLPCTPESDHNAPACITSGCPSNAYPGGGSAFMEMQFYPPGEAPFADAESCDNTHWCAALNIDSLECTYGYAQCNPNCTEPVNFAFIQRNGIPAGPPSPSNSNLQTYSPNADTLLMNPGDKLRIHMWDALVPGEFGERAFKVQINDLTTKQSGSMQASAANGFENTSLVDCSTSPYDFEPEYKTAKFGNITPWAADIVDISTQYEIGHFEPCTSLSQPARITIAPGISDTYYNSCAGPYEQWDKDADGSTAPETSDAFCYPAGDTHGILNSDPNVMSQCNDNLAQNGDLDFDGSGYWREWPVSDSPTAKYPGSFVQDPPVSNGTTYGKFYFTTDTALSESTCSYDTQSGCTIPPPGPGHFYPYFSLHNSGGTCGILFGNVSAGVKTFGGMKQYGKQQYAHLGYPQFLSKLYGNGCKSGAV